MKKALSLILALVMCLSLCACGGGISAPVGDTNAPVGDTNAPTENIEYSLGDTIVTDKWEITLSQVTFGTNLCKTPESKDYMIVDGDYETSFTLGGETYACAYVAKEGRAFVAVAYTLKYTGKEKIDVFNQWPSLKVNYNDGYLFEDSPYFDSHPYVWTGTEFEEVEDPDIEPLSPEAEYRDCFDVPIEVKENTTGSVKIIVDLGKDGTFTYAVR